MKYKYVLLLLSLASMILSQTKTFEANSDTYVHIDLPTANNGNSASLLFENRDKGWTYIKFDLSSLPTGLSVTNAQLKLYYPTSSSSSAQFAITRAASSWSENSITWNTRVSWIEAGPQSITSGPASTGWKEHPVTALVQKWITDGESNYGFLLFSTFTDGTLIVSSRETSNVPKLIIEYEPGYLPAPQGISATRGVYSDRILIGWNSVAEANNYNIYRNTSNNSSSANKIASGAFSPGNYYYYDTNITPNTDYYYWVKATRIESGIVVKQSDFSSSVLGYATVDIPTIPINPNPHDGATNVSIHNLELTWSSGGGDVTYYEIYFGTDPTPDASEYIGAGSEPQLLFGYDLVPNTTYYWRVDAVNSSGTTTGDVWHFTTASSLPSNLIWEDNFNSDNGWTDKVYQGEGSFEPRTYDGENVCVFYMSGSPGVFYTFKQLSQAIAAGSILKARWYYESSGSYSNSENSDGGHILFFESIPSIQNDLPEEVILDIMGSVDFPMYQWNVEEFQITEEIPNGSYIAIGGAVWPSYIYNNWDYIKIYSSTTDISTEFSLPSNYKLYNNYPNPFNPTTKIKYQIPRSNLVQIVVYDILGRKVATLITEQKPAGSYEVEFNASQLSNGVYFYELRAGDFRDVKKLVLLK